MRGKSSRYLLLLVVGLLTVYCGGAKGIGSENSGRFEGVFINGANQEPSVAAWIEQGDSKFDVSSGTGFCEMSPFTELILAFSDITPRVKAVSGPYQASSTPQSPGALNLIVCTKVEGVGRVDMEAIGEASSSRVLGVKDAAVDGASNVDVYVTPPDASLSARTPNFSINIDGQIYNSGDVGIPNNTPLQVRWCQQGTKRVVADFGVSELPANHYLVTLAAHSGTTLIAKKFVVAP